MMNERNFPVLPQSFYLRPDVLQITEELLGKFVFTRDSGIITGGKIVEAEAYDGTCDRASHAYPYKKTPRTSVMFESGGVAYVYLCYGIHQMFNIITNEKDIPHAILIRAIEPAEGLEVMMERRNKKSPDDTTLTSGPGALAAALGIGREHNRENLINGRIWIEDRGIQIPQHEIIKSPRVGVNYAGEDALLPWRFRIKGNRWTSPAR